MESMDERSQDLTRGTDEADVGTPRWVKLFGIIGLVLVVAFAILHLTGNGFGRHMHGGGDPAVEQRGE
jgi:hypothetical protein